MSSFITLSSTYPRPPPRTYPRQQQCRRTLSVPGPIRAPQMRGVYATRSSKAYARARSISSSSRRGGGPTPADKWDLSRLGIKPEWVTSSHGVIRPNTSTRLEKVTRPMWVNAMDPHRLYKPDPTLPDKAILKVAGLYRTFPSVYYKEPFQRGSGGALLGAMAMRPASQRALERQANEAKTWGRTIATGMRLIPTMLRVWMAENIRTVESEPFAMKSTALRMHPREMIRSRQARTQLKRPPVKDPNTDPTALPAFVQSLKNKQAKAQQKLRRRLDANRPVDEHDDDLDSPYVGSSGSPGSPLSEPVNPAPRVRAPRMTSEQRHEMRLAKAKRKLTLQNRSKLYSDKEETIASQQTKDVVKKILPKAVPSTCNAVSSGDYADGPRGMSPAYSPPKTSSPGSDPESVASLSIKQRLRMLTQDRAGENEDVGRVDKYKQTGGRGRKVSAGGAEVAPPPRPPSEDSAPAGDQPAKERRHHHRSNHHKSSKAAHHHVHHKRRKSRHLAEASSTDVADVLRNEETNDEETREGKKTPPTEAAAAAGEQQKPPAVEAEPSKQDSAPKGKAKIGDDQDEVTLQKYPRDKSDSSSSSRDDERRSKRHHKRHHHRHGSRRHSTRESNFASDADISRHRRHHNHREASMSVTDDGRRHRHHRHSHRVPKYTLRTPKKMKWIVDAGDSDVDDSLTTADNVSLGSLDLNRKAQKGVIAPIGKVEIGVTDDKDGGGRRSRNRSPVSRSHHSRHRSTKAVSKDYDQWGRNNSQSQESSSSDVTVVSDEVFRDIRSRARFRRKNLWKTKKSVYRQQAREIKYLENRTPTVDYVVGVADTRQLVNDYAPERANYTTVTASRQHHSRAPGSGGHHRQRRKTLTRRKSTMRRQSAKLAPVSVSGTTVTGGSSGGSSTDVNKEEPKPQQVGLEPSADEEEPARRHRKRHSSRRRSSRRRSRRRSKKHGPKTAKTNPNELTDIQRKVFEQMQIEAAYEAMKKNREAPDLINTTTEATKQQAAAAAAQPAGVAPKQPYTPPAAAPQQAEPKRKRSPRASGQAAGDQQQQSGAGVPMMTPSAMAAAAVAAEADRAELEQAEVDAARAVEEAEEQSAGTGEDEEGTEETEATEEEGQ